jgi:hypothetical protein
MAHKQLVNFSTADIRKELERREKISKTSYRNRDIKELDKLINRVRTLLTKEKIFNVECVNLLQLDEEQRNKGKVVYGGGGYIFNGKEIRPSDRCYRNDETPESALIKHIKMKIDEAERCGIKIESLVLGIKGTSMEDFFHVPDVYDILGGYTKTTGQVIKKIKFFVSIKKLETSNA